MCQVGRRVWLHPHFHRRPLQSRSRKGKLTLVATIFKPLTLTLVVCVGLPRRRDDEENHERGGPYPLPADGAGPRERAHCAALQSKFSNLNIITGGLLAVVLKSAAIQN